MHLAAHGSDHGSCSHHGASLRLNRAFAIAIILNVLLVAGEAVGGALAGSLALLADAGHNLGDVAGLVLAWWAHWLRGRGQSGRWTYGWRSFTILAANINALLLVVAIVGISIESVRRLFAPSEISEWPVLIVALVACGLNFATARLLSSGSQNDLNIRGAYLHMLADAAVSLAVFLGALAIMGTGWTWIDPAISLGICLVLSFSTWALLKESTTMLMNAAPRHTDVSEIRHSLEGYAEIEAVPDLHVWSVSTTDVLLTARVFCPSLRAEEQDAFLATVRAGLRHDFSIAHSTLEVTRQGGKGAACPLDDGEMRNILT